MPLNALVPFITALFVLVCAGCDVAHPADDDPVRRGVPVVRAERIGASALQTYPMTFYGRVRASQRSTLGFELAGQIEVLLVDDGDRVQKGQELARLDTALLRPERKQLIAEEAVAAAVLNKLRTGERDEVIASAQAEANRLRAELRQAEQIKQRAEQLRRSNAVSEQELEAAIFGQQASAEAVEGAEQRLSELEAGTRPEDIAAQESRLAAIQAQREHLDARLGKSILRAPFDGVVSRRILDDGATVAVGQPVMEILRDDSFEARFALPIALLEAGKATREISVRCSPLPVQNAQVVPRVDQTTRTVELVLAIDKAYSDFTLHGDSCSLQLDRTLPEEGFSVPVSALVPSVRGLWSCYRLAPVGLDSSDDQQGIFRVVKEELSVVHADGDDAIVHSRLPPGSLIVTEGVHKIVPGMEVCIAGDLP